MNDFLSWLLGAVQSVDPAVRTVIAGLAMVCETSVLVGLIVPGDTIVIVAGTAVASPLEGVGLVVAVIVGSLIGESVGFWLGRTIGPAIQRSWVGRRIGENHWESADRYLARRGGPAIFISRFLPVLHSLVPLTVGMSEMRYRRFIAWTLPACAVWATAYVTVAALAAKTYRDQLASNLHEAGYVFVGIIVVFLLVVFGVRVLLARRERRHYEHDDDANAGPRGVED
jgi:membrane-associated protein